MSLIWRELKLPMTNLPDRKTIPVNRKQNLPVAKEKSIHPLRVVLVAGAGVGGQHLDERRALVLWELFPQLGREKNLQRLQLQPGR